MHERLGLFISDLFGHFEIWPVPVPIRSLYHPVLQRQDFVRAYCKDLYRLVNIGLVVANAKKTWFSYFWWWCYCSVECTACCIVCVGDIHRWPLTLNDVIMDWKSPFSDSDFIIICSLKDPIIRYPMSTIWKIMASFTDAYMCHSALIRCFIIFVKISLWLPMTLSRVSTNHFTIIDMTHFFQCQGPAVQGLILMLKPASLELTRKFAFTMTQMLSIFHRILDIN